MINTLFNVFPAASGGRADDGCGYVFRLRSDTGSVKLLCGHTLSLAQARAAGGCYLCQCGAQYVLIETCACASCAAGSTCWRTAKPVIKAGTERDSCVTLTRHHLAGDVLPLNPSAVRAYRPFQYGGVNFVPYREWAHTMNSQAGHGSASEASKT